MPWKYVPPKPKTRRTHPAAASVIAALMLALAGDVSRNYGLGDVSVSFVVLWLMYSFWKLL